MSTNTCGREGTSQQCIYNTCMHALFRISFNTKWWGKLNFSVVLLLSLFLFLSLHHRNGEKREGGETVTKREKTLEVLLITL